MRIDLLTLFPEMVACVLRSSILGRAAEPRADGGPPPVGYHVTDIRDFTADKHGKVDKPPYGGGPGMVIQAQPVWDAVQHVEGQDATPPERILMTPGGEPLRQPLVEELAAHPRLLLIAGHYEGMDQRVIDRLAPRRVSIGDYVLTGGELPALALIDAVVRLLPGVLGNEASAERESFASGQGGGLDHAHYTRPPEWMGMAVPEVLRSGDHAAVEAWRRADAERRTREQRPDLREGGGEATP